MRCAGGVWGRGAASRRLGGRCVPRAACVPLGFKGKVFAHSVLNTCLKVNIVLVPLRHRAAKCCPCRIMFKCSALIVLCFDFFSLVLLFFLPLNSGILYDAWMCQLHTGYSSGVYQTIILVCTARDTYLVM